MRRTSLLCVLAGLLAAPPAATSAQSLVVRVTEAETARPILGVFVSVFAEDGRLLGGALTNAEGRALVRVREAGAVRVRAQMIGRATGDSRVVLPVGGDAVFQELALAVLALPLTGIEVVGSARCALRREEGEATLAVWEEARKALEVAAWSLETELFRYQIELRTREYGPEGTSVRAEKREVLSGYYREPFVSRPASDLAMRGFVQQTDQGPLAFAPGAAVLLSDPFLDTHCFRLRSAREDALIGLGFEPLPGRDVPDIRGVIWVDRATGDLRSVEFSYTGLPEQSAGGESGGSVEFERLPSGAWIVRRWWIRTPIMGEVEHVVMGARVFETRRVGTQEEAGEVVGIQDREGTVVATSERAFLGGVVFDSVRGVPLADAPVFLVGTAWEGRSDAEGRFRIPDLPAGTFTVDVAHPALDSLGLKVIPREVTVEEGGMSWVELAVPRFSPAEAPDVQGVQGWVQDPGGRAAQGIFVTLLREDGSRVGAGLSDSQGGFRIPASVPGPLRIRLEAIGHGAWESAGFELPPGQWFTTVLRYSDSAWAAGAERLARGRTTVSTSSAGRLAGRVVASETGDPLVGVEVVLPETGRVALSDQDGRFQFPLLEPGSHAVRARFLGREVAEDTVALNPGESLQIELRLSVEPIAVEGILVEVERRDLGLELAGFFERRTREHGIFFTREQIEERKPVSTVDLFVGLPEVRVLTLFGIRRAVILVGSRSLSFLAPDEDPLQQCYPTVWIDDKPYFSLGAKDPVFLDELVGPSEIAALEIYQTTARIPVQYNLQGACGVIVIWTRRD